MSKYGQTIYIEDLDLTIPYRERQQSNHRTTKSINRGQASIRTAKPVTYDLIDVNDETLAQLEELVSNPFFFATPIRGISDKINSGAITRFRRTWQVGASPYQLSLLKGSNKWLLVVEAVNSSLHDRWNHVISEDFSTDTGAWPNVGGGANVNITATTTPEPSLGDSNQTQDIPWTEVAGDWEVSETVEELVGDQVLYINTNAALSYLVAGWDWWSDYVIEGELRRDTITDYCGIVFRFVDASNHYQFRFNNNATQCLFTVREGGANTDHVITHGLTTVVDVWYRFKAEVMGDRIKLYLNGSLIYDEIHDNFSAGTVGLYSYNSGVYFDRFRVTLGRPTAFNLPPDIEWTNQYVHTTVNTAHGTQKKLIAPTEDVQFTLGASDDDCLLWLKMDEGEGNTLYDHSKNKNHSKLINTTWTEDDEKGWCIEFNGTDSYTQPINELTSDSTIDQATIDLMVYMDDITTAQRIFDIGGGYLADDSDCNLYINAGSLYLLVYESGASSEIISTTEIATNTWYRITAMFTGEAHYLFLDGKLVAQSGVTANIDNSQYMLIGEYSWSGQWFDGRLKNIRVYDSVRWDVAYGHDQTPATVFVHDDNRFDKVNYSVPDDSDCAGSWHFDEGTGSTTYDASGNANDGTLTNTPTWTDTSYRGEAGTCLWFDDSANEYVSLNATIAEGLTSWSITAWINADNYTGTGSIFRKGTAGGTDLVVFLGVNASGYLIAEASDDGTNKDLDFTDTATQMTAGNWYFVALTFDGTTIRSYINGVTADTATPTLGALYSAGAATATISETGATGFDGGIDEVRIHNKALSANEIAARYRSEPYLDDIYQSTRVYSNLHTWKGLPIISNGLIKLAFPDYDTYEIRGANVLLPCVYGWYDNSWHLLGIISPWNELSAQDQDLTDFDTSSWEITELTDQSSTIRIRYYNTDDSNLPEGTFLDFYLTVRNGYPGVLITTDDSNWKVTEDTGFKFWNALDDGLGGINSVSFAPADNTVDMLLDGTTSYTTAQVDDNWLVFFTSKNDSNAPAKDCLIGLFSDSTHDDLGSGNQWTITDTSNYISDITCRNTGNGGLFFVPYDVDDLLVEMDDGENQVEVYATLGAVDWSNGAAGSYSGTNYSIATLGNVANEAGVIYTAVTLDPGAYHLRMRVWSEWTGNTTPERWIIAGVDDDAAAGANRYSAWSHGYTYSDSHAAATWFYLDHDFYITTAGTYYIKCEIWINTYISDLDNYIDYAVVVPLSNGVNYPADIAHQGTRLVELTRGLKK